MKSRINEDLANAAVNLTQPIYNPTSRATIQFSSNQMRLPANYPAVEDRYQGRFTINYEGGDAHYKGRYFLSSYGAGCKIRMAFDELRMISCVNHSLMVQADLVENLEDMISYLQNELPRPIQSKVA